MRPRPTPRPWPALLALLTLAAAAPAAAQDKEAEPGPAATPYYPLAPGAEWHYRSGNGAVVFRAAGTEEVNGVRCTRLEVEGADKVEFVAAAKDGVFRHRAGQVDIQPPVCLLKLPPAPGQKWAWDAKAGVTPLKGSFETSKEEITVPAGKFEAIKVASSGLKLGTRPLSVTYWFARGVGVVRQRAEVGGVVVDLQLEKFVPGGEGGGQ